MILKEDIEKFEYLVNLIRSNNVDNLMARNLCIKYKMQNCDQCISCGKPIRKLFKKIKDYYDKNK